MKFLSIRHAQENFRQGDKVYHSKFGKGIIAWVYDDVVDVFFRHYPKTVETSEVKGKVIYFQSPSGYQDGFYRVLNNPSPLSVMSPQIPLSELEEGEKQIYKKRRVPVMTLRLQKQNGETTTFKDLKQQDLFLIPTKMKKEFLQKWRE